MATQSDIPGDQHEPQTAAPSAWLGEAAERLVRPYAELLADRIDAAAGGLRAAADHMSREEESALAEKLRHTAEQTETLAASARHDQFTELVERMAEFARARPAIFLGTTAAAGWALGLALGSQRATPEPQTAPSEASADTQPAEEAPAGKAEEQTQP